MMSILNAIKRFLIFVILVGFFTAGIDYIRMIGGDVPLFNLRSYDSKTHIQTFRGLFYIAERKISASEEESLVDSSEIRYKILIFDLNVPRQFKELVFDYTVETQERESCFGPAELYFANKNIKVYLFCLDDIQLVSQGKKNSLLSYLEKDDTILDDLDTRLGYTGLYLDGVTMKFESMNDSFANPGLAMYRCNYPNINDVYIGPKEMQFHEDFCTFKLDDFHFMFEVSDETPEGLEPVLDEEGNPIPEVFYEDEVYRYEFDVVKSPYVYIVDPAVRGKEEQRYLLKDILAMNILSMDELEKKGLQFNKIDKEKEAEEIRRKAEEEAKKVEIDS